MTSIRDQTQDNKCMDSIFVCCLSLVNIYTFFEEMGQSQGHLKWKVNVLEVIEMFVGR